MKKNNLWMIGIVVAVAVVLTWVFIFKKPSATTTGTGAVKSNSNSNAAPDRKPPTMTDVAVGNAQTPSEAFKMLFAAVKSQDSAKIKSMLSKGTMGLGEMAAGQQKKTIDEVVKNGFTETTFVDDYPQIRDERIKGSMGAVEVWNAQRKQWDDIPFILEDGSWKAAFGDAFANKWQSPGKGQAIVEQENANANNPNSMKELKPAGNVQGNFNSARKPMKQVK